jgi:membrane protein implicated in regulation of membrane protease activity
MVTMTEALVWLIAGLVLLGVELVTGTFVLLMLGGGALAAAGASALGASLVVDAGVFAVVSVLLMVVARPVLARRSTPELEAHDNSPVGSTGTVVVRVGDDAGQIKINGELWSARAMRRGEVFEPGEQVTVLHLSGVTAIVGDGWHQE